jgi:hypothetical protein
MQSKRVIAILLSMVAGLSAGRLSAQQATILVNNGDVAGLIAAITTLNGAGGGNIELAAGGQYVVTQPSDWWYGPNAFPAINSTIFIEGNGATISRQSTAPNFRFFYVSGGFSTLTAGALTLHNLTLQGGLAQGGRGGNGASTGGGAAGMGGVVFNQGQTSLIDVQLLQNAAQGGAGGLYNCGGNGGGGGLGANGGDGCSGDYFYGYLYVGGGGGFQYSGGTGELNGGGGVFMGSEGGFLSGGGSSPYGGSGGNGNNSLIGGGGGGFSPGENGGTPNGAPGGGNGGFVSGLGGPLGGGGGAFGGGGAGYQGAGGGGGVGGGGGATANTQGGGGGFGGGGGASGTCCSSGGFGGGAGSFYGYQGSAGGSGMGGAVFNHTGNVALVRTTASNNAAYGGAAGSTLSPPNNTITGSAGQGYGGVLFNLNGNVTIQDSSIAGANGNTANSANSVYELSSNQGNTVAGQTPDATLTQSNDSLTGSDLVINQTDGSATSQTASLPEVRLQPSVVFCGNVAVSSSASCSVTISNTGAATLSASFNLVPAGDFTLVNAGACASIAAQGSCTLNITFTAAQLGLRTGAIALTDNAPGSPQTVLLSGSGVTAPTNFTVSASPNPSVFGSLVAITATVSPSSATGTVTFYDGVTILGDAPVLSGAATLDTRLLPSGSQSLKALYVGSGSAPYASTLSTAYVQAVNAQPANALTAEAGSPFGATTNPFGTVVGDFNGDGIADLANANANDNTVSILLGDGSGGFSQANGSPFGVGTQPYSLVTADFNGDGIADLATANWGDNTVTVLLGDGAGGFTPASGSPFPVGTYPKAIAVGDFNGDGFADLAIANYLSNSVTVLLGNGMGGFTAASGSPVTVGNNPFAIAVADFNGDGKADLAVVDNSDQNVVVLLGDGHGGFTSAGSPSAVGNYPYAMVVADFDGDGKADLAVANYFANSVSVLLGNGSGGFTPASGSPITVGANPVYLAAGDFNGDGKADLAVANSSNGNVSVLLGIGGGRFTAPAWSLLAVTYSSPSTLAVGDFNGDGQTDLAVGLYGHVAVFLGAALPQLQVTQQPAKGKVGSPVGNVVVEVKDMNGNLISGSTATVTIASNPTGVGGTLSVNAAGGIATFSNLVFGAVGSYTLTASSPNTLPAGSSPIQIAKGSQTITFSPLPDQPYGTQVTVGATASSGLAVSFASTTTAICTVSGDSVTLAAVGKCTIRATQPGDANYSAAPAVSQSFQVTKASQTIAFGGLSNQSYGAAPFTVSATASSGLAVKFASTTQTICTMSGNTVTLIGVGKCTIHATQAGDANYSAAPALSQSFQVTKAHQTITFGALANQPLGTAPFAVSATASSGLAVSFASTTTAICTVSGNTVTLAAVGKCTIRATQAGNADYLAAAPVNQSFQVTRAE